ncbi:hypothetical protein C0995_002869 [Termitomyces sp. Mi166|nr:hypothetical protein C0995_002869 [Termitomyces sp. Mi166\
MPSSIKPRSQTPRLSRTPQPPPISYHFSATSRPSSQATLTSPRSSPPPTPSHGKRPSISNTMHWLSRNSSQSSSSPYTPAKPTRISEPKLIRSTELSSQSRSGTLGSGATVVRTPDEALRESGVRLTFETKPDTEQKMRNSVTSQAAMASASLPSPPTSASELSPMSPPLPKLEVEETESLEPEAPKPPRPARAPPSVPSASLRSSLKPRPLQHVEDVTTVPPLPAYLSTVPAPPPFRPILVSEVPTGAVDHSKIIVTIETSTASHKATLETLKSRPSHLSEYLQSLLPSERSSIASSIYSQNDDMSAYRHHLTSQGFLPQSFSVHLFMDRPSTPYLHIFNYLRSSLGSPDAPETLPRSIQMLSSHQRLEGLLELRDEAAYLGLEGLRKLCVDEIRLRHVPRLHTRGQSTSTAAHTQFTQLAIFRFNECLNRYGSEIAPYTSIMEWIIM